MKEEKANEDKLKKLEKDQNEAKLAQKKSLDEKIKKANAPSKEESKNDGEFLIRESKVEDEDEEEDRDKPKRMFVPDFDVDEVPPLEWYIQLITVSSQ